MKKSIFVLALIIASMLSVQAQNLARTAWTTMVPGDQELEMCCVVEAGTVRQINVASRSVSRLQHSLATTTSVCVWLSNNAKSNT